MLVGIERREFQRLSISPPIPATLGANAVALVEIGVLGARVHHGLPLDTSSDELRFSFGDDEIALRCELVRTSNSQNAKYPGSGLESGLRFVSAIGESGDRLRHMLATLVSRELDARRTPEPLIPVSGAVDGDKTIRGREAMFLAFRLEQGIWQKRAVFLPEQPEAGFTVARNYDEDEIQRLCRVYQASDEEGRRLIRLFAELSVSETLSIPPKSF